MNASPMANSDNEKKYTDTYILCVVEPGAPGVKLNYMPRNMNSPSHSLYKTRKQRCIIDWRLATIHAEYIWDRNIHRSHKPSS